MTSSHPRFPRTVYHSIRRKKSYSRVLHALFAERPARRFVQGMQVTVTVTSGVATATVP
ncbi:MAG TPA: hypothetical protein VM841_03100 [Actinomycetota bacterium]|nr:hypothetical protein [Actinomycetota bacterium]